jgi:ClpP class serine protease
LLDARAWGAELGPVEPRAAPRAFAESGPNAIVEILGPLLKRSGGLLSLFCDDYESIAARVKAAAESPAERVVLRIDSPGGDAGGCFELARELRAIMRAAGKPLVAFADGYAASAAYAIACAADEIHVSPTSFVGSIGVLEMMFDTTGATAAQGIRLVAVSSGEAKLDRNPDVAISEDAISRVQAQVDQLAGLFFDLVSEMRGIPVATIKALNGGMLLGNASISPGLADAVSTWADVLAGKTKAKEQAPMSDKDKEEARAALRRMAESDNEMGKKAQKALKCIADDDEEKKEPDGDEAKAKAEEEQKKKDEEAKASKAKAAEDGKDEKDKEARAAASVASVARAAAKAEIAEQRERDALLSSRPDFDAGMRATLQTASIETVRDAVKNWAKRVPVSPAAASQAMPETRGATQTGDLADAHAATPEGRYIDQRMGLLSPKGEIKSSERRLELGFLSPADVQKKLAELGKGA